MSNPEQNQDNLFEENGLHICPECGDDFVCPEYWEEVETEGTFVGWETDFRCGQCDWRETRLISDADAQDFKYEIEKREAILERAYIDIEVGKLAYALATNLIEPEDFF